MLSNRNLARHIADSAWGRFVRKLEHKCEWKGKRLAKVDRWFVSSKTCSGCGATVRELPLSVRRWTCPA